MDLPSRSHTASVARVPHIYNKLESNTKASCAILRLFDKKQNIWSIGWAQLQKQHENMSTITMTSKHLWLIDPFDVSSCDPGSALSHFFFFASHGIMWQGGQTDRQTDGQTDGQTDREWCPCNATVAETMSCQSQRVNCCGVNTLYAPAWCRPCQVIVVGVLCIWKPQWYSESLLKCLYICKDVCCASGKWEESTSVNSLSSTFETFSKCLLFWKWRVNTGF